MTTTLSLSMWEAKCDTFFDSAQNDTQFFTFEQADTM